MSPDPLFTGITFHTPLEALGVAPVKVAEVQFEDGSVTYWHSHEGGQVLAVMSGAGRYQERGEEERILRPGETVVAPPGVDHWHGAAEGRSLRHVAISSGETTWHDAPH